MSVNIKLEKTELREGYKTLRKAMSPKEKKALDEKIANRLIGLWAFRECKTLMCYISKDIEVDTVAIVETALKLGKSVAAPRCIDNTRQMSFYRFSSYDELQNGSYGLLEPQAIPENKVTDFSECLCVVPAISFDEDGYRLGFAKGYYDRFLSNYDGRTVGICYSSCVNDALPRGRYDRKVDMLVTEKKLYICND